MKNIYITFLFVFSAVAAFAQQYPVQWATKTERTTANTYKVFYTATFAAPWHLYSQNTPKGGPVPTKFVFSKNALLTMIGSPAERGLLQVIHDKYFGVDVKFYSGKVDFVQTVKRRGNVKTNLNTTVTYMVCNDHECLPPIDKSISVQLE